MKGQNGEASQYVLHGDALKKIVRKGKKRPMPFAFVPEYGDDDGMFAVHKKRKPEMIARATRLASGQSRVAWGTFTVIGRVMELTCINELPSIAKKLRRHLRLEKIRVDIRVLDRTGRELETDVDTEDDGEDTLGDDDDEDDDDDAPAPRPAGTARDGAPPEEAAAEGAAGGKPKPGAADDPLAARIAAITPAIEAAAGPAGEKLRDLLAALLKAREDHRREVPLLLKRLEGKVQALASADATAPGPKSGRPPQDAPPRNGAAEGAPAADPRAQRAEALRIARGLAVLRRRIDELHDTDAVERLMAALSLAARAVKAGNLGPGAAAARQVADALRRVEARQAAAGG